MSRSAVVFFCFCVVCAQPVLAQQPDAEKSKKKSTALTYSIACTLAPAALGGGLVLHGADVGTGTNEGEVALGVAVGTLGLIFGPGAGHVYAKRPKPMKGAIVRVIGAGIAGLGGIGIGVASSWGKSTPSRSIVFIAVGGSILLASVIYDISTVSRSVEQYNHQRDFSTVTVCPHYFVQDKAVGVIVTVRL